MQYNSYWHSNPQYHSQQMHAMISLQTRCGQATSDDTSTFGTCYEDQVFFRGSIYTHLSHIAQDLFVAKLQAFAGTRTPGVVCQFHAEVRKPRETCGDSSWDKKVDFNVFR